MAKWIAILEDNADRIEVMRSVLEEELKSFTLAVYHNAPELIEWLNLQLIDTVLICLDHDLGPNREKPNGSFDPGTGRDVANYLSTQPAVCPVVVHSSNAVAVPGMLRVLNEGSWLCSAIVPSEDVKWITNEWSNEIQNLRDRQLIYG